jgi:hypothetical protein
MAILPGPPHETDGASFDQQVLVWGSQVDVARLNRLAIVGIRGRKWTGTIQGFWQAARTNGRNVQGHQDGSRQVWGQVTDQLGERRYPTGRATNHNDVMTRHPFPPDVPRFCISGHVVVAKDVPGESVLRMPDSALVDRGE